MSTMKTTIQIRRDTTANWLANKDVIPAAGEPVMDTDTGIVKYGDGKTTYENLKPSGSQATHYEGVRAQGETDTAAINRVLTDIGATAEKDDIFVLKTLIAGDKYSYTSFVYNGSVWAAMDGNYSADNVYFADDMTLTYAFGKYKPDETSGTVVMPAGGLSVSGMFLDALSEDQNPEVTDPAVSLTFSQAKAYEVGSSVTPSYSASLSAGSYTYGPDTGVAATEWKVTDTNGNELTTASGSFPAIVVDENTKYSITAEATHNAGTMPKTALGADYADGQIAAGTKSKTVGTITGFRSYFYGVLSTSSADVPLTSDIIRGMTNGNAYNGSKTFTLNGSAAAKRIVVAIPSTRASGRTGLKEVILTSAMNTPVTDSYTLTTKALKVAGASTTEAVQPVDYDVYVYEPSKIDAGEVHKITLA